jgi:TonB family protein
MRCATVLGVILFVAAVKTPQAASSPLGSPLPKMDSQRSAWSGDTGGNTGADHQVVSPRPNPDAAGRYHVGDGVSAPQLVYAPDPEFTDKARKKKLAGTVVVSLTVDATGKPQDVRISRSLAEGVSKKLRPIALGMDENAVKAVTEYRFKPAEFQGKPVPVTLQVGALSASW